MKKAFAAVLTLVLLIGTPALLFAKGQIVKITIKGAELSTPIEITDFANFKDVDLNVWAGPGVFVDGKPRREGFIVDWSHGAVVDRPNGLPHFEVSFYTKPDDDRDSRLPGIERGLVYVVYYEYDSSSEIGYVYLPGNDDKWAGLNTFSIYRGDGFEGNWFRATKAWVKAAKPLITSNNGHNQSSR